IIVGYKEKPCREFSSSYLWSKRRCSRVDPVRRKPVFANLGNMELLVYSSLWCPDCRTAKRFLDKHNISYTDIDIETTPGAADEVIRHAGKRAVPQFVIDGRWVQPYRPGEGFLYEEISKLLGIMDEG